VSRRQLARQGLVSASFSPRSRFRSGAQVPVASCNFATFATLAYHDMTRRQRLGSPYTASSPRSNPIQSNPIDDIDPIDPRTEYVRTSVLCTHSMLSQHMYSTVHTYCTQYISLGYIFGVYCTCPVYFAQYIYTSISVRSSTQYQLSMYGVELKLPAVPTTTYTHPQTAMEVWRRGL